MCKGFDTGQACGAGAEYTDDVGTILETPVTGESTACVPRAFLAGSLPYPDGGYHILG
jgi:hypothetical protein